MERNDFGNNFSKCKNRSWSPEHGWWWSTICFTFPPGANYVNELRGPVINDEDEEDSEMDSDQMDEDDEDDDGFGFFTEEEEEEFLEGELDHFWRCR